VTMTRRITLAILATAVAAIVLVGLGTLVLARFTSRADTEKELRRQATELATGVADLSGSRPRPVVVAALRRALSLEGFAILTFGPNGNTLDPPPAGITMDDLNVPDLLAGKVVSGRHGDLVFAAAPATSSWRRSPSSASRPHSRSGCRAASRAR
jgi:hypothetical protein